MRPFTAAQAPRGNLAACAPAKSYPPQTLGNPLPNAGKHRPGLSAAAFSRDVERAVDSVWDSDEAQPASGGRNRGRRDVDNDRHNARGRSGPRREARDRDSGGHGRGGRGRGAEGRGGGRRSQRSEPDSVVQGRRYFRGRSYASGDNDDEDGSASRGLRRDRFSWDVQKEDAPGERRAGQSRSDRFDDRDDGFRSGRGQQTGRDRGQGRGWDGGGRGCGATASAQGYDRRPKQAAWDDSGRHRARADHGWPQGRGDSRSAGPRYGNGARDRDAAGTQGRPRGGRPAAEHVPKDTAAWLLLNVKLPVSIDPGKDSMAVTPELASKASRIMAAGARLPLDGITVLRKSYDARLVPVPGRGNGRGADGVAAPVDTVSTNFMYTLLVDHAAAKKAGAQLQHRPGKQERLSPKELQELLEARNVSVGNAAGARHAHSTPANKRNGSGPHSPPATQESQHTVIVGAGPAGLFAALRLAESGARVTLVERGRPVERRGRDIGALFVRRVLDPESNLCYGEGGAGTWSDGKLSTKIGKNARAVRAVLNTLVEFGAPETILVAGKPHIGTDRLVAILRAFRARLIGLGVDVRFETRMREILVSDKGEVSGVTLASGEVIEADSVVLAPGHSARDLYQHLQTLGVELRTKPFAMGFRIEHPQTRIDNIQYGAATAALVQRGKGKVPVADYKLAASVQVTATVPVQGEANGATSASSSIGIDDDMQLAWDGVTDLAASQVVEHAETRADAPGEQQEQTRGVYSFCMCPGGQIVPTSVAPDHLCINGMSFSRRNSPWANSAVVAEIKPTDWAPYEAEHGTLAAAALQSSIESRAAAMTQQPHAAPAQRVLDFLDGTASESLPKTSYRLGVEAAPLHELYPPTITDALRQALWRFDSRMRGFLSDDAVLIGPETRTSAPVTIVRDDLCQCTSVRGLYPAGEGAGYAGGIMSAAVDGLRVADAILGESSLSIVPGRSGVPSAKNDYFMY